MWRTHILTRRFAPRATLSTKVKQISTWQENWRNSWQLRLRPTATQPYAALVTVTVSQKVIPDKTAVVSKRSGHKMKQWYKSN